MNDREIGIVRSWFPDKNFGFVSRDGAPDVFFYVTEIAVEQLGEIEKGARVEYTVTTDDRGRLQAASLEVL